MQDVVKFLPIAALIGLTTGVVFIVASLFGLGAGFFKPWQVGIVAAVFSYLAFLRTTHRKTD